jgi:hypothetical protein
VTFAQAVQILGLPTGADMAIAHERYRDLVKECHPDRVQGSPAKARAQKRFLTIRDAYEVIRKNPHLLKRRLNSAGQRPQLKATENPSPVPAPELFLNPLEALLRWLQSGAAFRKIWAVMFAVTVWLILVWALLSWPD